MTLELLIATHRPEGIRRVAEMALPQMEGVSYIVSWQSHGDAPVPDELSDRTDIRILRFDRAGVSRNRNNALDNASGDILLISDDDLRYTPEAFTTIIRTFEQHPEVDYASFRHTGSWRKRYPQQECDLTVLPKGFYQTAFEVAVRRESLAGKLRFHPEFGPGAPRLVAGEDEFFLLTARRWGINCRFFPVTIADHPGLTTGSRPIKDPRIAETTGALITLATPKKAILRFIPNAWRLSRNKRMNFFNAIRSMIAGRNYLLRHPEIHTYLNSPGSPPEQHETSHP